MKNCNDESQKRRYEKSYLDRIVEAVNLIVLGIILLLNTTGQVPWSVWPELLRFWPLLLILGGIEIIFSHTIIRPIIKLAGTLLFIFIFLWCANSIKINGNTNFSDWFANIFSFANTKNEPVIEKELRIDNASSEISSRTSKISIGGAEFTLTDNNMSTNLVIKAKYYENFEMPTLNSFQNGSNLDMEFTTKTTNSTLAIGNKGAKFDMYLGNNNVTTNLNFNLKAGKGTVDLKEQKTGSINADVGVGDISFSIYSNISLPSDTFRVNVGTGKSIIRLPKNVGLKIKYSVGAGEIKIDNTKFGGLGQNASDFRSENYDNAVNKIYIDASVGVGSIEITRDL